MKLWSALFVFLSLSQTKLLSQTFSCPTGQADMMKYFAMSGDKRDNHNGQPNPIFTRVFPDTTSPQLAIGFGSKALRLTASMESRSMRNTSTCVRPSWSGRQHDV